MADAKAANAKAWLAAKHNGRRSHDGETVFTGIHDIHRVRMRSPIGVGRAWLRIGERPKSAVALAVRSLDGRNAAAGRPDAGYPFLPAPALCECVRVISRPYRHLY